MNATVAPAQEPANSGAPPERQAPSAYPRSLVTLADPGGPSAESIRAIRTHVLAQHVHAGRRGLAVCSPNAGSGCTFVAANLAVAVAQIGLRVLLIDADLRDPGVHNLIEPGRATTGLSDVLAAQEGRLTDAIEPNVLPNLSILYAGKPTMNAQELLGHHRFKDDVQACLRSYDLTILDTPPANAYADARRIGAVAGFALLVARRHRSLVPDVKTLCHELQSDSAVVIGTVLNG